MSSIGGNELKPVARITVVDSPRKGPVTRKMFPFDDVVMTMSDTEYALMMYAEFDGQLGTKPGIEPALF